MPRSYPLTDLVKLVRAYGLLAGTCDAERVIAGELSRRWIATEVEHPVPMSALPPRFFDTPIGREMLADELFAKMDLDPDSLADSARALAVRASDILINSNRLPKLEPALHASVLSANLLLGVRLYGRHGKGARAVTHDLIIAAMLQPVLGKPYRFNPISPDDFETVDTAFLNTWFGDQVADRALELQGLIERFYAAADAGLAFDEDLKPSQCTALAAICASELRLVARAAGDQVISFLDRAGQDELLAVGVDPTSNLPERPFLARGLVRLQMALALPGTDHYALRKPVRSTLVMAVRDVLDDPTKRARLSGPRGKATHDLHVNLPVMEYFVAAEHPNSIETVHIASLEMIRALEKGRRKSLSTMTAHAFRIAAIAERVLGRAMEPIVVTLALLHDVVEDGGQQITGYGHSLRRLQFRFGGPIAAMVSELTDSSVVSAGAHKAKKTLEHPHLLVPQAQYTTDRFTEMTVVPTATAEPYTLSGIVIKLLDTVVSLEEGIRDPELMSGYWRHSGARIYWAERVRGSIVYPLVQRLRMELELSHKDPRYASRPHHVNVVRLKAGLGMLELVLTYQHLYCVQNLAILAQEYGLTAQEREVLIRWFHDPNVDEDAFQVRVLDQLLDDERLRRRCRTGGLPELGYSIMYPKGSGFEAERDTSTFLAYHESALARRHDRTALGLDSPAKLTSLAMREDMVLRVFDDRIARLKQCGWPEAVSGVT